MVIHKWKVWVVRIAFLCGLLIISSTLQTEAATKNSWTVKVNNEYKAKLVKKKESHIFQFHPMWDLPVVIIIFGQMDE